MAIDTVIKKKKQRASKVCASRREGKGAHLALCWTSIVLEWYSIRVV